jgi:hypothetical protein
MVITGEVFPLIPPITAGFKGSSPQMNFSVLPESGDVLPVAWRSIDPWSLNDIRALGMWSTNRVNETGDEAT